MKRLVSALFLIVALSPVSAFGFGEVFKVETTGTEYCGDFFSRRISPTNNVDWWVRVVSDTELSVSYTPDFQPGTFFAIFGQTYQTGSTSAAFVGGQLFQDLSYVTIQGKATYDKKTGAIKSLAGTFISKDLMGDGCFSSGTFKTVRRVL
ncbi:MAG: hypothetical protein HY695_25545 [Deltaproteobacteria bacterium]|nr:hypothetical protein [Deltaproteobacteria bacterium]